MAEPLLLAFDLGTTRLKVVAFDERGALLGREASRHREHADGERAWQDPDAWWADACALSRRLLARPELARREVAGCSLSGRGGGFVALDGAGATLAGSWSDRRHAAQLAWLVEWRREGGHLANYAAALLAKLLYLREHEPAVAARVRHALYAKDFLLYRMTDEAVTDPTSGPDREDFDPRALAHARVARELLPRVAPPWAVAGRVTPEAARALGVPAGVPVAVGGHDGICANVGAGAGTVGAYAVTIGTHAVVRAVTAEQPPGSYRFYGLPPGRHVIGGNAVMAGRAADWFVDTWLEAPAEEARAEAFARVDAEAAAVPPGARGVRFLPFLAGQVAPDARPGAAAAFVGLRASHGRGEMFRALLEGGAFAIRSIFEQVRGWCGEPAVVRFTGSGAQSEVWRGIIVDALGRACEVTDHVAEARGAAIYLAVALGLHPNVDEAAAALVRPSARIEPDAARAAAYEGLYREWLRVAEALRPLDASEPAGGPV